MFKKTLQISIIEDDLVSANLIQNLILDNYNKVNISIYPEYNFNPEKLKKSDIIVLDHDLDNKTGLDLLRDLNKIKRKKKSNIVVVSGQSNPEVVGKYYDHKIFNYIIKSDKFQPELIKTLDYLISEIKTFGLGYKKIVH